MIQKSGTPASTGTLAGVGRESEYSRFDSCIDYNTAQDFRQDGAVSSLLRHGAENATTARELSQVLGWEVRAVTRQVERERRAGIPICANGAGYFLPGNDVERDRYLACLAHREAEIRRTRAAVAQTRQQRMNLGGGDEA